ncbi:MAG: AAA family ATPase [Eubacteriales bacterium]|nr:AAA family ATPase [Eubacteriales bacterium]
MNLSKEVADILSYCVSLAKKYGYEFITPELILVSLCHDYIFSSAFVDCGGDIDLLENDLMEYMNQYLVSGQKISNPQFSIGASKLLMGSEVQAKNSGKKCIEVTHLLHEMWNLPDSYAVYYMSVQDIEERELLQAMIQIQDGDFMDISYNDSNETNDSQKNSLEEESHTKEFESYAPCMNDHLENVNPLIGRKEELERTIQILCRKDKNNPLHIGEAGVGKTAITYGLARLINEGNVPEPLKNAKIYMLDLGSLLAGTQFRGELEKRLKKMLEQISKEENPILYIDEIHNMAGAGAVGESSFDISNLLKPYLVEGHIRFIGATTYEEYKKYFEKNKSLVRRFQNVEIKEPSEEETIAILYGLKKKYEKYHGVCYGKGVLEYAVHLSKKYINERFLPDKAIDLMDEAGAYRRIHPLDQKTQSIGKDIIREIVRSTCHIPMESNVEENEKDLSTLEKRMLAKIFGQDEAVKQVVSAIKYARAGLLKDHKPLSSFLFAGPTGVGKTEIAKQLASELGISLIRFDMSEYGEKHAIAKLIGSPAGYVGYEEGGLLTESIRKNPNCVLLLDEIEKAHHDIFNVLLQVMDYATLTDNQGRKADFRNVIIIMTSNAGASQIGKPGLGFQKQDVTSDVIMEEVKRIFQPEFRNRLNRVVVFKSMDQSMGLLIAKKKLQELSILLEEKKVTFTYSEDAINLLCEKGSSREFGAREMDRIIQNEIKSIMVDELLFGKLKKGGSCKLSVKEGIFTVECEKKKKKKS